MQILFLLVLLYALYLLLVKGYLWKLIVFIVAWISIPHFLEAYFPSCKSIFGQVLGCDVSWAWLISTLIVLFAMATTTVSSEE